MKVNCIGCKKELDAHEESQTCECGWVYGLTPYFPYTQKQIEERNLKNSKPRRSKIWNKM